MFVAHKRVPELELLGWLPYGVVELPTPLG